MSSVRSKIDVYPLEGYILNVEAVEAQPSSTNAANNPQQEQQQGSKAGADAISGANATAGGGAGESKDTTTTSTANDSGVLGNASAASPRLGLPPVSPGGGGGLFAAPSPNSSGLLGAGSPLGSKILPPPAYGQPSPTGGGILASPSGGAVASGTNPFTISNATNAAASPSGGDGATTTALAGTTNANNTTATTSGNQKGNKAQQQQQQAANHLKSFQNKLIRMQRNYELNGCIRSVEAVCLVHQHGHPHILLLQMKGANVFRLPGGKCHVGESDVECLSRKVMRRLFADRKFEGGDQAQGGGAVGGASGVVGTAGEGGATASAEVGVSGATGAASPLGGTLAASPKGDSSAIVPASVDGTTEGAGADGQAAGAAEPQQEQLPFRCGEVLATWVRPNFERHMYPYKPPHVVNEKEVRTIYLVHLDPELMITPDPRYDLIAVPLFDLYNNAVRYGNIPASVPTLVSRLHINFC